MDLQIINYNGHNIRIKELNGVLYFVAVDLAKMTGHKNINLTINRNIDDDERTTMLFKDSIGRMTEHLVLNESGFYKLMFRSNKPEAKALTKHVTNVILPQIRRTGTFGNNQLQANVNQLGTHKRSLKILDSQISELNAKRRHEKSSIAILENVLFNQTLKIENTPKGEQTNLFSNDNNLLQ